MSKPPGKAAAKPDRGDGAIIPRATYRLQLHQGFTFDDAILVLPYLQRLGISHVYCSPIMRARPGSLHGYDVVAHDEINPELGGPAGYERFSDALRAHGMGQILDLVPNHMGVLGAVNPWWMDVLEHGPAAAAARHFDIDWDPANRDLRGKVLTPVLGEHYSDALEAGLLKIAFDAGTGEFGLHYHQHRFPIDLRTLAAPLAQMAGSLAEPKAREGLLHLTDAMQALPERGTPADGPNPERAAASAGLRRGLAELIAVETSVATGIDAMLARLDAPEGHDALHALLEAQAYRLVFWRVAADEINYRRFFDVNELAALRVEDPAVFEATHALPLGLAARGVVDGFRIDHPDGLYDPAAYFQHLQQGYLERLGSAAQADGAKHRLYVVAEKIAAPHEDVPVSWEIHGTTGYRFAMVVGGVLVDTAAEAEIDRIWRAFSGEEKTFAEIAYIGRRTAARVALASELTMHAAALLRIARADRRTRDYSYNSLRDALAEVAACMPVYRTYVIDTPSPQDLRFIDWAIAHARRRSESTDASIFDFIRRCLLNEAPADVSAALKERVREFATRFPQFCSPVAAKGVEDTAFYRFHRLISLNEVGGDPSVFGVTPRAFHGASADRAERWPHTILATSTHDNKRAEDVRNRISVLSEMPAEWEAWLQRWSAMADNLRTAIGDAPALSRADEYLMYQTLIGSLPPEGLDAETLPAYRERIGAYMLKAAREAKLQTGWMQPNVEYEKALASFVESLLARVQPNPLLTDIRQRAATLAWYGALNSLTMVLLKYTSPGVPDLYQGNELFDLSLVDPDNRRPVDYTLRADRLAALDALAASDDGVPAGLQAFTAAPWDGSLKLWMTWRLLQLRRERETLFRCGRYSALAADGDRAEHVLAFSRSTDDETVHVVAARLFVGLGRPPGEWPVGEATWGSGALLLPGVADGSVLRNALTGERVVVEQGRVSLATIFATLPAAVLIDDEA